MLGLAPIATEELLATLDFEERPPGHGVHPGRAREAMLNVEIVVEDENEEDPDLLGLYLGIPLVERTSSYAGVLPDKIAIYRIPLEEEFGDDPEARGRDRITVAARDRAPLRHRRRPAGQLGWARRVCRAG